MASTSGWAPLVFFGHALPGNQTLLKYTVQDQSNPRAIPIFTPYPSPTRAPEKSHLKLEDAENPLKSRYNLLFLFVHEDA